MRIFAQAVGTYRVLVVFEAALHYESPRKGANLIHADKHCRKPADHPSYLRFEFNHIIIASRKWIASHAQVSQYANRRSAGVNAGIEECLEVGEGPLSGMFATHQEEPFARDQISGIESV